MWRKSGGCSGNRRAYRVGSGQPTNGWRQTGRHRGVSLETVRRAILLGSVRKSMSLLDQPDGEPVRSESFPRSYWQHLEFNLRRC